MTTSSDKRCSALYGERTFSFDTEIQMKQRGVWRSTLLKVLIGVAIGSAGMVGATDTSAAQTACSATGWPMVEAECATLLGQIAVESSSLASAGKELGGWNYGGTATVTLVAPAAGTFSLQVRANSPYGVASRTVVINGTSRTFTAPSTSRSTITVGVVNLVAGNNTLVFKRLSGDDNVMNLDKVSVIDATPPTSAAAGGNHVRFGDQR
jgi:hypothetical protein